MPQTTDARRRRDLSTAEIARVAARLMREEGADAVTMRRVASECGVTAMALYHHVGNKEGLEALVVDGVVEEVVADFEPGPDWRSSMVDFTTSFRAALLGNPGAAAVFLRRPILSENFTRTTEILFEILQQGDVSGPELPQTVDAVVLLTMGTIANDLSRPAQVRTQLLEQLPREQTPLLAEHIAGYAQRDGEQRFQLALSWLMDGIERRAS